MICLYERKAVNWNLSCCRARFVEILLLWLRLLFLKIFRETFSVEKSVKSSLASKVVFILPLFMQEHLNTFIKLHAEHEEAIIYPSLQERSCKLLFSISEASESSKGDRIDVILIYRYLKKTFTWECRLVVFATLLATNLLTNGKVFLQCNKVGSEADVGDAFSWHFLDRE